MLKVLVPREGFWWNNEWVREQYGLLFNQQKNFPNCAIRGIGTLFLFPLLLR